MKTLSKNNAELRIIPPIIISVILSLLALNFIGTYSFLFIILGIIFGYRKYIKVYNLLFDEKHLILKNRKQQRKIDLGNIRKIELTLSDLRIMGFQFYEYKINFKNESGLLETVNFFGSNIDSPLWDFQDLIKNEPTKGEIKNTVERFDK